MTFRPSKKSPRFADLKGILSQSKKTDNALYQTVQLIIERLDDTKDVVDEKLDKGVTEENILKFAASKFASYLTKNDDTSILPQSIQLLQGAGIIFDDSVPGKRYIKTTTGGGHYDAPLSDGDLTEADLIYAAGECIIVQVPV